MEALLSKCGLAQESVGHVANDQVYVSRNDISDRYELTGNIISFPLFTKLETNISEMICSEECTQNWKFLSLAMPGKVFTVERKLDFFSF